MHALFDAGAHLVDGVASLFDLLRGGGQAELDGADPLELLPDIAQVALDALEVERRLAAARAHGDEQARQSVGESRWYKSARKLPCSTRSARSRLPAAMSTTSAAASASAPTGRVRPLSSRDSSFAWSSAGSVWLIAPWMLVEVEADAVVGDSRGAGASVEGPEGVETGPAGLNEHAAFASLLEAPGLPVPDERDAPVAVRFARRHGEVIGCVGCERHGYDALLRSLAVREAARGLGVGAALVRSLLAELDAAGVRDVYLLTLDAARFFERLGFEAIDRSALPVAIASSRENVMHACDEAVPMRRGGPAAGT